MEELTDPAIRAITRAAMDRLLTGVSGDDSDEDDEYEGADERDDEREAGGVVIDWGDCRDPPRR